MLIGMWVCLFQSPAFQTKGKRNERQTSMAFKVETYEVENSDQSEASVMAQDSEAAELIERLGLGGQKMLLNPTTQTRNPYRVMTKDEQTIYGALLSEHTTLEHYSDDCIPLRVLQVAAHAKECGLFDCLEVWHADPAVYRDDPLLVGKVKTGDYTYRFHILARWGRELLNLEQLEALAIKVLRPKRMDQCQRELNEAQQRLEILKVTNSLAELAKECNFYVS